MNTTNKLQEIAFLYILKNNKWEYMEEKWNIWSYHNNMPNLSAWKINDWKYF